MLPNTLEACTCAKSKPPFASLFIPLKESFATSLNFFSPLNNPPIFSFALENQDPALFKRLASSIPFTSTSFSKPKLILSIFSINSGFFFTNSKHFFKSCCEIGNLLSKISLIPFIKVCISSVLVSVFK